MDELIYALEIIGAAAFAVSGAMAALEHDADIFGVIFLAVVTALGGGVIRDLLLGVTPPKMFVSYVYLAVAALAALVVFADAYIRREKYRKHRDKLDSINNMFDAVGLAVFTVSGMNTAMQQSDNVLLILVLGMSTGVGGGMLRDMLINKMPKVLRKRVYAVASLLGGGVYYGLFALGVHETIAAVSGMALIIVLRVLATVYKWNLPAIRS
ncbi:MAG: trimeric intracellular cation channel family protein [Clostridia bacterium]|nr:trimeric intracellular cation channel family protein [Clostridia bacterium]